MNAIELKKVFKTYRKGFRAVKVPAVTDLSFVVRTGRITGFVGPNGAGKTTTIKMITGLVHPTSGTLELDGLRAGTPASRKSVAYLSEQPYFYQHLTVEETLHFTSRLIGIPHAGVRSEAARVLETVELEAKRNVKVKELSKGMQQRLNMAQALLGNPRILILDEPMSGMDPPGRRLFRDIIRSLKDEDRTVFFSTHVLDDIESACDDVVVLQQGRLTYCGDVGSLLDKGFTGTEIITAPLTGDLLVTLEKTGCAVSRSNGTELVLFVNRHDDPAVQLKILADHAVFPKQVVRRAMRLEEVLYNPSDGRQA